MFTIRKATKPEQEGMYGTERNTTRSINYPMVFEFPTEAEALGYAAYWNANGFTATTTGPKQNGDIVSYNCEVNE